MGIRDRPLPKELDPRLEPPLAPPSGIVRPLTAEETARRERELAPVPTAGLKLSLIHICHLRVWWPK